MLRRVSPADRDRLQAGELVVDRRTRDVRVGGRRVALAAKEYELLLKLRPSRFACSRRNSS